MKQLLIPIVVGLLAGLGGGSGYAYMRASAKFAADSAHLADSLKIHPAADSSKVGSEHANAGHDEQATGDSAAALAHGAPAGHDSTVDDVTLTPADSIRALEAARAALRKERGVAAPAGKTAATAGKTAGATTGHSAAPNAAPSATPTASGTLKAATAGKGDAKPVDAHGTASPASATTSAPSVPSGTASAAALVKSARDAALNTPIPEQRLAKIFSAMSAKDAAKVLDQMTDADIRGILASMNDRQAAAILTALPAGRAAAITKTGNKPTATP